MHTEAINHDPAITFFQTGTQIAGRPSIGAWLSYGLGRENENLPAFVVLITRSGGRATSRSTPACGAAASSPSKYQGVQLPQRQATRCSTSSNPDGVTAAQTPRDARHASTR